jgi:hypothetical protein
LTLSLKQAVTKEELLNVVDHLFFEERMSLEQYEKLYNDIRNIPPNGTGTFELIADNPVYIVVDTDSQEEEDLE